MKLLNHATKQALRSAIRQKSIEIDAASRRMASHAVFAHVLAYIDDSSCYGVIGFESLSDELDTAEFESAMRGRDVRYHVTPNSTRGLEKDVFDWIPSSENNSNLLIIVVPAIAFDRSGIRLGRGKGYYDRLLATLRERGFKFIAIGVGYEHQLVEEVPKEAHDQPVDFVCTPLRGLIKCKKF